MREWIKLVEDAAQRSLRDPRTNPAFRRWFGISKVVDSHGKPLVVYRGEHGESLQQFHSKLPSLTFSSASVASTYAMEPNDVSDIPHSPRVIAAYLRIVNPVIENYDDPFVDLIDVARKLGPEFATKMAIKHDEHITNTNNWYENFSEYFYDVEELLENDPDRLNDLYMDAYLLLDDPEFVAAAKAAGYDGAIHLGNGESFADLEFRIFDESQAKSAFNKGTFNDTLNISEHS